MPTPRPKLLIFDIDGTVANSDWRQHLIGRRTPAEWDAFFRACGDDPVIEPMFTLAAALYQQGWATKVPYRFLYITARPERVRPQTLEWLRRHNFPLENLDDLIMRPDDDIHRPGYAFKQEAFLSRGYDPADVLMAFDDHSSIITMWRSMGIHAHHICNDAY